MNVQRYPIDRDQVPLRGLQSVIQQPFHNFVTCLVTLGTLQYPQFVLGHDATPTALLNDLSQNGAPARLEETPVALWNRSVSPRQRRSPNLFHTNDFGFFQAAMQ